MSLFVGERPSMGPIRIKWDGSTNAPITVVDNNDTTLWSVTSTGVTAIAGADELTAGGVIVPTALTITTDLMAASVDKWIFVAPFACQVLSVREIHSVAGGSGAAARPRKIAAATVAAPGAAVAAGITEITTAAFDLTTTADTTVTGTLSATASDYTLAVGDKIGIDFAGTLTALVGHMTISIKRV